MSHYEKDHFGAGAKYAANRLAKGARRLAFKYAKRAAKFIFRKVVLKIVISSAPVWVPVLLILMLSVMSFDAIYAGQRQVIEDDSATEMDLVSAFLGFTSDEEVLNKNKDLFERYEKTAEQWKVGLSEEQIKQAEVHGLSWAVLAAVDRLTNDPYIRGEKEITLDPEGTEEELRPHFDWETATFIYTTQTCTCREITVESDDGEQTTETVCEISTVVDTKDVSLITNAYTLEGHFHHEYEDSEETTYTDSECGTLVHTTEYKEISHVTTPAKPFQPFYDFLAEKGIFHESDIELTIELIKLYDLEYAINFGSAYNLGNPELISNVEDWVWVTDSTRVTSSFGKRWGTDHNGVDIGALTVGVMGDPIYAMEDCTVQLTVSHCAYNGYIGNRCGAGYGNQVVINHGNGLQTRYAHLQRVLVRDGQSVEKGQIIGTMGNSGSSNGIHLHFEIRINNVAYDPAEFFTFLQQG